MSRLVLIAFLALASPAGATQLLVVGRDGDVLRSGKVKAAKTRAAGCRVPARTPIAALLATTLRVKVRDYGGCDPGGLYVYSVAGQRERGRDGWVYKTAHRTPSVGAAAVKARKRVLWFWCHNGTNGCQRTLEAVPEPTDDSVRVFVTAHDDRGKWVAAEGATVTLGDDSATTNAAGVATLPLGHGVVVARQKGRVRSFPVKV